MKPQLSVALLNILFGVIFTYFSIRQVSLSGWGILAVLLAALAAYDFTTGFRILFSYFKTSRRKKE